MKRMALLRSRYRILAVIAVGVVLGFAAYVVLRSGDSVVPLMKAEGSREELKPLRLSGFRPPFAIVEIAFDRETAERAWDENTPEDLPRRTGAPEKPGIYGDLDEVDFETHAVVVWSSGESSSCPGWLADIDVTDQGTVSVRIDDNAGWFGACPDDYNAYRMLVAVDRDRLPASDVLPTEDVAGIPSGLVTTYPAAR